MVVPHSFLLFDASTIVLLIIIAYLSRRIGEALKIKPFYRILYVLCFVIAAASVADTVQNDVHFIIPTLFSIAIRLVSAGIAFIVSLRYWGWLFTEYLKK